MIIGIKLLKLGLEMLPKLLRKAQEDCFKDRIITETTYKIRADKYKERIAEIKSILPVLESIVSGKKTPQKRKGKLGLSFKR